MGATTRPIASAQWPAATLPSTNKRNHGSVTLDGDWWERACMKYELESLGKTSRHNLSPPSPDTQRFRTLRSKP